MEDEKKTTEEGAVATEQKKVSIARALKELARLGKRLLTTRNLVKRYNSVFAGTKRPFDIRRKHAEMLQIERDYREMKSAIVLASAPVSDKLASMMVLRGSIAFRGTVDVREVVAESSYDTSKVKLFDVAFTESDILTETEKLQRQLDDLQDEVDAFNATHNVAVKIETEQ